MKQEHFEKLFAVNVNEHTEDKNGLTYLSWDWAWAEVKKVYPDATYEIEKFNNNLPYVFDELTGYMVFTKVTIEDTTYEMWLPVMDSNNKAMKDISYEYKTKYGARTVEPATMFDINKTIMRCLVKNLAMFGLGLYIYSGEDLPEGEEPKKEEHKKVEEPKEENKITPRQIEILQKLNAESQVKVCTKYKAEVIQDLTMKQASEVIAAMLKKKEEK